MATDILSLFELASFDSADIDTDYIPVNQLVHEYYESDSSNIIVNEELYNTLNK